MCGLWEEARGPEGKPPGKGFLNPHWYLCNVSELFVFIFGLQYTENTLQSHKGVDKLISVIPSISMDPQIV